MAKKEEIKNKVVACNIKSRVNYDVKIQFDGRDMILAPKQQVHIPDKSLLGFCDPTEVIIIIA